jgi:hypothetical protein
MAFSIDGTFLRLLGSYDLCVVRGLHKRGAPMAIVLQVVMGMALAAVFLFVVGEKDVATVILSENLVNPLASQSFASSVILGLAGGLMVPNVVSKLGAAHSPAQ